MPYKDPEQKKAYHKKYHAEWYQRNKKDQTLRLKLNRAKRRAWVLEYKKSHPCVKCRFDHHAALDFHHYNDDKEGTIAEMIQSRGLKQIQAEVAKCDVLCANCHRIHHWNEEK